VFVANDLQRLEVLWYTAEFTVANNLERRETYCSTVRNTGILAANVGGVSRLRVAYAVIRMFTQASSSAQYVENALGTDHRWRYTFERIPERNGLNVVFVANDLQRLDVLLCIAEFTVANRLKRKEV